MLVSKMQIKTKTKTIINKISNDDIRINRIMNVIKLRKGRKKIMIKKMKKWKNMKMRTVSL